MSIRMSQFSHHATNTHEHSSHSLDFIKIDYVLLLINVPILVVYFFLLAAMKNFRRDFFGRGGAGKFVFLGLFIYGGCSHRYKNFLDL